MRLRGLAIIAAAAGLAACGSVAPLEPRPGQSLPVKPLMASATPTAEQLLTPPPYARPERVDELIKRSTPRRADRFDLPPPDGTAAPELAGEDEEFFQPDRPGDSAMTQRVRKAIFPVAGLGTRLLPATKSIPKELIPIVDRPLIQYAVDEAREAGIEQMIFVTGRGKNALVDYFDVAFELETAMGKAGKSLAPLEPARTGFGEIVTVRQQQPLGLGHAIWCARDIIGDEPFAVLLPDEVMVGKPNCLAQMVEAHGRVGGNVVAVLEVPPEETHRYGVVDPGASDGPLVEIKGLVEKPPQGSAPSNLMLPGRYILQPDVMRVLDDQEAGAGGEIQLTDAMAKLIGRQPFHGFRFSGRRHDCGDSFGFVTGNIALALDRPDIGPKIREYLKTL